MQCIESFYKMVSIKSKLFTNIRYEVKYNIEWRIRRKKYKLSGTFVIKSTN